MTKRMILLTTMIIAVGLAGLGRAAAADTLESVEKQLLEKWGQVQTMSAKVTIEGVMPNMTANGAYELMKKGDKSLFRMELSFGEQVSQTMIGDGDFVYGVMERMGQTQALKAKPDDAQAMDAGSQLRALRKTHELKLLPDQSIDGQTTCVIEATPKEPGGGKTITHFAKETGIMLRVITQDATGDPAWTMTMSDVKTNAKIDPSRFVFTAPPGVQVMDMTNSRPPAPPTGENQGGPPTP